MKKRSLGITLQYANTFLNMVCGLFLSAFLLRVLGDTEYGLYQTISSFVNYLVLLEFGTGTVITRNISVSRAHDDKAGIQKNVSTIWLITCLLVIIIIAVGSVFYFNLNRIYAASLTKSQIQYGKQIFLVMLAYLVFSFLSNTANGILIGFEKYEIVPAISAVRMLLRTLVLVVLVLTIRKSIIIAIVDLFLAIAAVALVIAICKVKLGVSFSYKFFDFSVFKASFPLAAAIFIQVLVNQANNNVDKFIIGIKIGPEAVAVYSVGLYIYSIFSSLTTIPIAMYGPQVAKEIVNGYTPDEVSEHLIQPSRLIVIIGGTVLCGFFAVGRQFVAIVYGTDYMIAWKVALIIMLPMLINMSNGIMINILDAMDKRMARSGLLLLTTCANIFLTVLWIEKYGVLGACIATAVCTIIGQVLLMDLYYYRKLRIRIVRFRYHVFSGIVLCQILSAVASYLVGNQIKNTVISFVIGGVLYVCLFGFSFVLLGSNKPEKEQFRKIIKKLYRRISSK